MICFFFLSLCGLLAGTVMHLSALMGSDRFYDFPTQEMMFFMALFASVPAIYYSRKGSTRHRWISDVFSRIPKRTRYVMCFLLVNLLVSCFINPFLFTKGHPIARDDAFLLVGEHGYIHETITEDEFHELRAAVVRAISSFWMLLFFGLAFTLHYNREELKDLRTPEARTPDG